MRPIRVTAIAAIALLGLLGATGCTTAPQAAGDHPGSGTSGPPAAAKAPALSRRIAAAQAGSVKAGVPVTFEQLGAVQEVKVGPVTTTHVWHLDRPETLPVACSAELLRVRAVTEDDNGSSWLVTNTGSPCTISAGAVRLTKADGKKAASLVVSGGTRQLGVQVLPAGEHARFQVDTSGPCQPSKAAAGRPSRQKLNVTTASGDLLGTVSALMPACSLQAPHLALSPFTEEVHSAEVPAWVSARLMTATLQQHQNMITATLFVTNTGKAAYSTPTCPTVNATVLTPKVEVNAVKVQVDCLERTLVVAARSSIAVPLSIPVPRGVDLTLANVTVSLSLGLSDDASRSRIDA